MLNTIATIPGYLVKSVPPQPGCVSCDPISYSQVGGGGGTGGTLASGLGSDLLFELPETGYGGGGGGSSGYEQTVTAFGFTAPVGIEAHVGGGGEVEAVGLAVFALQVATSSTSKGRSTCTEAGAGLVNQHVWTASPGGGGGGGAGGLVKLQALRSLNEGTIDVSGGSRGGGFMLDTIANLPSNLGGVVTRLTLMERSCLTRQCHLLRTLPVSSVQ